MPSQILKKIVDAIKGKAVLTDKRSSRWPAVRAKFISENDHCAVCGSEHKLEVHHKVPFNTDPSLELDPNNLITLCESTDDGIICHLFCGHSGSYKKYNPDVEKDSQYLSQILKKAKENK